MKLYRKSKHIYATFNTLLKSAEFPYERRIKKHNCIFIHTPRTGGTSILSALGKKNGGRHHLPWYVYKTANPLYFEKTFKFSFTRNPWDRTYSAYKYLLSGGNQKTDSSISKMLANYENFSNFVTEGLGKGTFRSHLLFLPQSEFIVNGEGKIVVDFLGRYENLQRDSKAILEKLNISSPIQKTNSSTDTKCYREAYLTKESIEIVSEIYRQDINIFNYSF